MQKFAVLVLALFALSAFATRSEKEYQDAFISWMRQHQRSYSHDQFRHRYNIFKANLDLIDSVNAQEGNTFTLAMNHFGDLSGEEFKTLMTGLKVPENRESNVVELPTLGLPTSVDWRKHGAVTPVKNQGQCGSCWSFSTTGSLEGLHAIKTGKLLSFSEQQLVDCSTSYGNNGCNGGLMDYAFKYVEAKGIELESEYPYTARDGTCKYEASKTVYKNHGYKDVAQDNDGQLEAAVAQQPVSVAIEADRSVFQFYNGGIINSASCGTNLDHGVLAVGYGSEGGVKYWIVKNSWGSSWGEQGYVRIARSSGAGICGINKMPSYPTA